jgi:hypothetical protein
MLKPRTFLYPVHHTVQTYRRLNTNVRTSMLSEWQLARLYVEGTNKCTLRHHGFRRVRQGQYFELQIFHAVVRCLANRATSSHSDLLIVVLPVMTCFSTHPSSHWGWMNSK